MYFIYVFNKADCEKLLNIGFKLLKSTTTSNVYIFENNENLQFDSSEIIAFESDVLTF